MSNTIVNCALLGQAGERTFIEIGRVQSMTQWWQWVAVLAVCLLILAFVVFTYRRDSVELPTPLRILLTLLRVVAFAGLLIFFLQIEKRTEKRITKNSRVAVLVDTSQSMALRDVSDVDMVTSDSTAATIDTNRSSPSPPGSSTDRRIDRVTHGLGKGGLVQQLSGQHDVRVYGFAQDEKPVEVAAVFKEVETVTGPSAASPLTSSLLESRWLATVALLFFVLAIVGVAFHIFWGRLGPSRRNAWGLLFGVVCLIVAVVTLGVSHLRNPSIGLTQLMGASIQDAVQDPANEAERVGPTSGGIDGNRTAKRPNGNTLSTDSEAFSSPVGDVDWKGELEPRGGKTRLGDALRYIVDKERGGSLAGVVVFTDGNVNAGSDPREAARVAGEAGIPLFNVGLGSDRQPANVRVSDIEAPARVFPGDAFTLRAFVQAAGLAGQRAKVGLFLRDGNTQRDAQIEEQFLEERQVLLPPDGEALPVEFELTPSELGTSAYVVRVTGPATDIDPVDNRQSVNVRVVDRKNRVLMIAGGPMRDYRFLRTQAYRDKEIVVDVLLQSSPKGAAQEADHILQEFPETPQEMYAYDCVCAFDPDWEQLSVSQLELLEEWVATQAGGLIVIAGPVHTPEWTSRRRDATGLTAIKSLYPVTFYSRASITLGRGAYESAEPTALSFSDAGRSARFLWLEESAVESEAAWDRFDGVYGYQPIRDVKPGAKIYARFGSPEAAINGKLPPFMVGQFYGAGRVFYLGSGEIWRLRALDTRYFEQFYTRLIRYVSEGRLSRDSNRGLLLLDKDRCSLGETVSIRASLTDAQHQPVKAEQISASIVLPDGARRPIELRHLKDGARDGVFVGQFAPAAEGDYQIELILPDTERLEVLTRDLRVRLPDVEVEHPQRNDALLNELARTTEGKYFVGMEAATRVGRETDGIASICASIIPQDQETYLPGTPDLAFERRLMGWLLVVICGALCLEWLLRRLYRLA